MILDVRVELRNPLQLASGENGVGEVLPHHQRELSVDDVGVAVETHRGAHTDQVVSVPCEPIDATIVRVDDRHDRLVSDDEGRRNVLGEPIPVGHV